MFKHNHPMIRYARGAEWQRGSALIFALVFLLVMTVIGIAGMQGTTQQEKMAGNMRNRNLAFQAAEAALRAGEKFVDPVKSGTTCPRPEAEDFNGTNGLLEPQTITGSDDGVFWMAWDWKNNSRQLAANTLDKVAEQPSYVVEYTTDIDNKNCANPCSTNPSNCSDCYRITARGVGGTTDAIVILQSTYQWNSANNRCNPPPSP